MGCWCCFGGDGARARLHLDGRLHGGVLLQVPLWDALLGALAGACDFVGARLTLFEALFRGCCWRCWCAIIAIWGLCWCIVCVCVCVCVYVCMCVCVYVCMCVCVGCFGFGATGNALRLSARSWIELCAAVRPIWSGTCSCCEMGRRRSV